MNRKSLTLVFATIVLTGLASAEIGFTDINPDLPDSFVGGETIPVEATFVNYAGEDMPVVIELSVENDNENITFDDSTRLQAFNIELVDYQIEGGEEVRTGCTESVPIFEILIFGAADTETAPEMPFVSIVDEFELISQREFCAFEGVPEGEHTVELEIYTNDRLRSGEYDMSIDLKSVTGTELSGVMTEEGFEDYFSELMNEPLTQQNNILEDGSVTVTFNEDELPNVPEEEEQEGEHGPEPADQMLEEGIYANLKELGGLTVSDQPGDEYLGGMHVNMMNPDSYAPESGSDFIEFLESIAKIQDDVIFTDNYDIGGVIEIEYDEGDAEDLQDLGVYRLDDAAEGDWTLVSEDVEDGVATAEVDHFSTFAVFGDEIPPSTGGGSSFNPEVGFNVEISHETDELTAVIEDQTDLQGRTAESRDWDLGDGNFAEGEIVEHNYEEEGEYDVSLTIELVDGRTFTGTEQIEVSAPEEEVVEEETEGFEETEEATEEEVEEEPETGTGPVGQFFAGVPDFINSIGSFIGGLLPF